MKKLLLLLLLVFLGCGDTYLDLINTSMLIRQITIEKNSCVYTCTEIRTQKIVKWYYLRDTCNKYRIGDTLILNVINK